MSTVKMFAMAALAGVLIGGGAFAACYPVPGGWVCDCDGTCKIICDAEVTRCRRVDQEVK